MAGIKRSPPSTCCSAASRSLSSIAADASPPEGRTSISFDPFDDPVRVASYGESRGIAGYAALLGGAFLLLSTVLIFALSVAAPHELAPMPIGDEQLAYFAKQGYFPLSAAAASLGRGALGLCANLQMFAFAALAIFGAANSARRGFVSERVRGWSNGLWIGGLAAICFAPSLFPELTPQTLDYAVTGSWGGAKATPIDAIYGAHGLNRMMFPAVFFVERAVVGVLAIVSLAYVMHDLGYRAREALEDFGFIEERAEAWTAPHAGARARRGSDRRFGTGGSATGAGFDAGASEGGAAFGQRDASGGSDLPDGRTAQARRVLGVSAAATRREIERAYRSQMKRAHPDHGGSVERAAALNAARDTLLGRR